MTEYAAHAWDGEGTRSQGGRWTSPGKPAVYVAESAALATLEILVHLRNASTLASFSLASVTFPASAITTVPVSAIPHRWRESPPPLDLRKIGDRWLNAGRYPVLEVPSAVISTERNYLLNPMHPDFNTFKFNKLRKFDLDPRLLSKR